MARKSLTDKQKLFAAAYVAKPNATKAATIAGYSKNAAKQQAHVLLTNTDLREYIDQGIEVGKDCQGSRGHWILTIVNL